LVCIKQGISWPLLKEIPCQTREISSKYKAIFYIAGFSGSVPVCLSGKLMLALTSTVILGSESCGTHDHIFLSHYSRDLWNKMNVIQLPH
jgi:hypothetical protein